MCAAMTELVIELLYFFSYKTFPSKTMPKNLDPSYKMDQDLWDCLGRVKFVIIVKFHMNDLVIWGHSVEGKTRSYS